MIPSEVNTKMNTSLIVNVVKDESTFALSDAHVLDKPINKLLKSKTLTPENN
jgi:hypothetical protein